MLFSTAAAPVSIPTSSAGGFPFLHTPAAFVSCPPDSRHGCPLMGVRCRLVVVWFAFPRDY